MNKVESHIVEFDTLEIPEGRNHSIRHISRNLYLAKDSDGRGGILLSNVDMVVKMPSLENLQFLSLGNKTFHTRSGEQRSLQSNLMVRADKDQQIDILHHTVKFLLERFGTQDDFTSFQLRDAVLEAVDLWREQQSRKQDVVGVVGELYWLSERIAECSDGEHALFLIEGWESSFRRTNIDFSYEERSLFFEVKTSSNGKREHRFKGIEQLELLSVSDEGYLCSIMLVPSKTGFTAYDLTQRISDFLIEQNYTDALLRFNERCSIRGNETQDRNHMFQLSSEGVKYFRMNEVKLPVLDDSIVEVSWVTDFEHLNPVNEETVSTMLNQLKL